MSSDHPTGYHVHGCMCCLLRLPTAGRACPAIGGMIPAMLVQHESEQLAFSSVTSSHSGRCLPPHPHRHLPNSISLACAPRDGTCAAPHRSCKLAGPLPNQTGLHAGWEHDPALCCTGGTT